MRRLFWTSLGILCFIALLGCNGGRGDGNTILVGEYGDMSGPTATFGTSTHDGIMLAVEELNAAGGINGKKVEIKSENDRGDATEARNAVTKLIQQDHVVAMLGEVASTRSKAGGEICQEHHIPMVSPSSTNPEVTRIGDYIFRVCFLDDFQGAVMAVFAIKTLHAKTAAIMVSAKQDYSVGLARYFKEAFEKHGGKVVASLNYTDTDQDFKSQLTTIKGANPDVIFVPGYYGEIGTIARQAKEIGLNSTFIGGDGWDSTKLIEGAAGALEGAYFSNHYAKDVADPVAKSFLENYKKKYGHDPDAIAALGYDAANVLFDAMKRAGSTDPKKVRDALAQTKDFKGVTGTITIDANRNASKPAMVVQVVGKEFKFKQKIGPEDLN